MTKKEVTNPLNFIKTPSIPEVKFNKSGYEIRTEILNMAKDLVATEYTYKWQGWEMSSVRDEKTGQIVTSVDMPQYPGLDKVLETAQKMYDFVELAYNKK